jgi:protoheme IX farnesyltransferase
VSSAPRLVIVHRNPAEESRPAGSSAPGLLGDYATLLKVRVTSLVVVTAWAGFYLACVSSGVSALSWKLFCTLMGIGLVSGGAAALNQVIERDADRLMVRTRRRPLPAKRMSVAHAVMVGMVTILGGGAYLAWTTNPLTGFLTILTAASYVGLYTPLKKHSHVATFVGAFPGAMPPLLGWTAARGRIEWESLVLFAILFLWQFPHFHAIGWLYREDYRRAGIRMLPAVEENGRSTVREVLAYTMLLIPVSLFPGYLNMVHRSYIIAALMLGAFFLVFGVRFAKLLGKPPDEESRRYARQLLRASIIYLPLLFGSMMIFAR